jgi:hypothetical protein
VRYHKHCNILAVLLLLYACTQILSYITVKLLPPEQRVAGARKADILILFDRAAAAIYILYVARDWSVDLIACKLRVHRRLWWKHIVVRTDPSDIAWILQSVMIIY